MRILNVKDAGVTRGVVNDSLKLEPNLREVTFLDFGGVPHTVFAHTDGPFKTPEDIVQAWYDGTLHDEPAEETADDDREREPQVDGN